MGSEIADFTQLVSICYDFYLIFFSFFASPPVCLMLLVWLPKNARKLMQRDGQVININIGLKDCLNSLVFFRLVFVLLISQFSQSFQSIAPLFFFSPFFIIATIMINTARERLSDENIKVRQEGCSLSYLGLAIFSSFFVLLTNDFGKCRFSLSLLRL